MMQLAPMRYTRIEGTAVAVSVTSAVEAKAALKELRHKKRELKFLKSALLRRQKVARARQSKPKRASSWLWRALMGLGGAVGSLMEVATVPRETRRALDPQHIELELRRIDETVHNIDGCVLQLEGKLLTLGGKSKR
ncbi:MAG TPA: hypothetical protein VG900_13980 [Hyphomicrobiaceae bacterium]|nr:hypothetical protein [Hyphomicrobiaceae bacterium]